MRWGLLAAVSAAALAFAPAAFADDVLTLQPGPSDSDTYARWVVGQGLPDSVGSASQALVLRDAGAGEAAVVFLRGAEGQPVSWLTSLEWERRDGSICNIKDPRWTIGIAAPNGASYEVRLGCSQSRHSAGIELGWTRDWSDQQLLRARIVKATGDKNVLRGTITSLSITLDSSKGDAVLDDIGVGTRSGFRTWRSPADNGYIAPTPEGLIMLGVDATPWTTAEETPADDLIASLTPEEQYAITDEAIAATAAQ